MNSLLPAGAVKSVLEGAVGLRHAIHREPEIALEEHRTREKIRSFLGDGFRYREPLLGTDLIAEWPGKDDSACIALRADMDGLALHEETGLPWSSEISGMMHACGHDGHVAVLAATARMLSEQALVPPVTVRFVFQPGEEVIGAGRRLAEAGAYDGAKLAFALHGWPGIPLGSIATKEGSYFSASHAFSAVYRGRGGHGAFPERCLNPLPAASRAILALEALHTASDRSSGEVVSACSLQGGNAANVIPESARILGTIRYLSSKSGKALEKAVRQALSDAVAGTDILLELEYNKTYDQVLVNHPSGCRAIDVAAAMQPSISLIQEATAERASEDFAFALKKVPGALFKLGLGEVSPLHSPGFDFSDDAIETGIRMMGRLAIAGGAA